MEALVEGEILKTCASAESGAARTAVQASRARRLLLDPAAWTAALLSAACQVCHTT
jgi:hypothetical protein